MMCLQLVSFFLFYSVDSSAFVLIEDVVSFSSNFKVKIQYGGLLSRTSLSCSVNDITQSVNLEADVQTSVEIPEIDITSNDASTFIIDCSTEGSNIKSTATLSIAEPEITVCDDSLLFTKSTSMLTMKSGLSSGLGNPLTISCSGNNLNIEDYVTNSNNKEFSTSVQTLCTTVNCQSTLGCSTSSSNAPNINGFSGKILNIITPLLFVNPLFQKLGFYKNGTFIIFIYPNEDATKVTCFVNKIIVNDYASQDLVEDTNFDDIKLEIVSDGVYNVYPKLEDLSVNSGIYGIKCSASLLDSQVEEIFLFEFHDNGKSDISSDRIDFESYVSVACSCDLTPNICDGRCCCDSDCSSIQKESFKICIGGSFGGHITNSVKPDCVDVNNVSPLEHALCIKKSNSAYLGKYFNYVNSSTTQTVKWLNATIAGTIVTHLAATKEFPIFTKSAHFEEGFLTLPGATQGVCISGVPLRMLQNSHQTCQRKVATNCNLDPSGDFSARSYLSPQSTLVDPCQWYTQVFSNGFGSSEAVIKIVYMKDDVQINHLTSKILNDQTCTFAVTDVLYDITVNASEIFAILATVSLSDLSSKAGETVITSYKAVFNSLQALNPSVVENVPRNGYLPRDPLQLKYTENGTFSMPEFGDCSSNKENYPKFGTSSIAQCYVDIEDDILKNCSALHEKLINTYSTIIENGTEVLSNKDEDAAGVPCLLSNFYNSSEVSNQQALCDNLPSFLHIKVYHARNDQSGFDVTNVTYYFEYGSGFQVVGTRAFLYADLQFLISDLPKKQCTYCLNEVIQLFENHQQLLNSLLVVFAGLICFAVPNNFLLSRL